MTSTCVRPAAEPITSQSPRTNAARSESSNNERATFERLLRNRDTQRNAGQRTEYDQEPKADSFGDGCPGAAQAQTIQPGTQAPQTIVDRAGTIGTESASALRQSEQARMADPPTPPLAGLATDKQGTWQATLPNPGGADWHLRASRDAGATPGATGWSVSISSPAVESTMLQRNTARLTERLQERLPGRTVRLTVNSAGEVGARGFPAPAPDELTSDEDDPR